MSIKKISILLLLVVMCLGLTACNVKYDKDKSSDVLQTAITETFKGDTSYITIRHSQEFNQKTMSGEPKKDENGNLIKDTKLVRELAINSYITTDAKYAEGTRLSEIILYKYDEFGKAKEDHYWAGKEKGGTTSYLIHKNLDGVYHRQIIKNENIFEYAEFKQYDKNELADLKYWYDIKPENYNIVSGDKAGAVETIVLNIKKEYSEELHSMGDITVRITNGKINCIQVSKATATGDTIVTYQVDYLQAGAYINIPTTKALNEKNTKDENGKDVIKFIDNFEIVKEA